MSDLATGSPAPLSTDLHRPNETRANPGFPWFASLVLAFTGFLSLTIELLPSGLLTAIAPDLDASVAAAGSVTAAYALGVVITVLPLTRLAVRLPSRTALVVTVLLFVASNVLVAVAPGLGLSLVGRFLGGASHGVIWAILPAIVERIAGPRWAGRSMALVFTGNSLGLAVGAPLSTLLGAAVGWRLTFGVAAGAALVAAILLARIVPATRPAFGEHMSVAVAAREPGALRVIGAWALVMLGHFGMMTYIAPYLERLGVGAGVVGLSLFILGAAGMVGVTLAGRLSNSRLMIGLVGAPVLIVAAFALLILLPATLPVVLLLLVVWGMGFSGTVLLYQRAVLVTGHRAPETVTSISVLLSQLGIAVGAAAGGVVVNLFGVDAVPVMGIVVAVAALLLLPGLGDVLRLADAARTPDPQHAV